MEIAGFEPAAFSLQTRRATTALNPQPHARSIFLALADPTSETANARVFDSRHWTASDLQLRSYCKSRAQEESETRNCSFLVCVAN